MNELERHYRFHLRRMALGLAFSLAMGVTTVYAILRPGLQFGIMLLPAAVFVLASVGLNVALRGWRWPSIHADDREVGGDEWVRANIARARKMALQSIYVAQVPLMFFVAYVPPDPTVSSSVIGMALLTMTLGALGFFGSYLVYSRQHVDG